MTARRVVKSSRTETFQDSPILELIDIDGDNNPDQFAYSAKGGGGGDTQHFGFVFDLNEDGKVDYFVFYQGTMIGKPFKIIHTFYHMIDSNYDGRIDIWVNPDTDLDQDNFVDEGVFSWLYDSDFDGGIDKGEYLGNEVSEPMECKEDVKSPSSASAATK